IPGPVIGSRVRTTNLPWEIDGNRLERSLGCPVVLLNDLEAAAHGVLTLGLEALVPLQSGQPDAAGHRAVIAAGTGLGQALLVHKPSSSRGGVGELVPTASEGGHTDFAPRDEEEIELWRFLRQRHGHVSYERIVSGPGLVALYEFYAARLGEGEPPWRQQTDRAQAITEAAARGVSKAAHEAVERFCSVYGAEAGNLALKTLARGGVYVAGGIAPKMLSFLQSGSFIAAFRDKGRYRDLMEQIPVLVVLDEAVNLRGAAHAAAGLR
ncbi:MAG: glucokinase, partial [Acidobacteriota bacterium]